MIIFLVCHIITVVLAFNLSLLFRYGSFLDVHRNQYTTFLFVFITTLIILYFYNSFNRYNYIEKLKLFFTIIKVWLTAILFYLVFGFLTKYYFLIDSRAFIIFYFFVLLCMMTIFHLLFIPRLLDIYHSNQARKIVCKFIGPDEFGRELENFMSENSFLGLTLAPFIDKKGETEENIREYFLYSDTKLFSSLYEQIKLSLRDAKPLHVASKLFDELHLKWEWARVNGIPIYVFQKKDNEHARKVVRRIMDIVGATLALIVLSPFFFIIALAIKLDSKGPIIYKQKRCGHNGKEFVFYKFRSMRDKKRDDLKRELEFKEYLEKKTDKGKILSYGEITAVGLTLRRASIDELPQLCNVLRGEMSLVGPRPPIPYEVKYYKDWHKDRLSIKQGLTGLWQIYGRGEMPGDKSIFLDMMYVINRSLFLDVKLILQTIPAVLLGKGAY